MQMWVEGKETTRQVNAHVRIKHVFLMGLEDRDCVTLMLLKHIFKIEDIDYGQSSFIMYFVQSDQVKVLVAYHSVI